MIPTRPKTPRCHLCDQALGGPRLVLDGLWTCPDCAYEREYGAAERRASRTKKQTQEEKLFEAHEAARRCEEPPAA